MPAFGVASRSPVAISPEGELTYNTEGANRWESALQFARMRDAMAFLRLCEREGLNEHGHALHVVTLSGERG